MNILLAIASLLTIIGAFTYIIEHYQYGYNVMDCIRHIFIYFVSFFCILLWGLAASYISSSLNVYWLLKNDLLRFVVSFIIATIPVYLIDRNVKGGINSLMCYCNHEE